MRDNIKTFLRVLTIALFVNVVAFGMPISYAFHDNFRRHIWNEARQLAAACGNQYCGYYAYDTQGNRAYKLTGMVVADQYDAGTMQATAYFDDITLYVNPYMVVTPRGYTKHYYNGSQRIAARLGGSWTKDSSFVQNQQWIAQAESLWETTTNTNDLDEQEILREDVYVGGNGSALPACQYSPNITQLSGYFSTNLLSSVFSGQASERTLADTVGIYFYHLDHLGSANWITNSQGQAVQYIHYMPYGEVWVNQQTSRYDERFKFTGKERDTETGYDYFGARYYSPMLGHWLSVDKLADDYPHITPYAQSAWNPIKYKDPDGNFVGTAIDIICVGMDLYSLAKNIAEGNTQAALVDAGALAIDALAVLVPGATAGAGIAVKAARAADKGKDVAQATTSIVANSHNYRKALQQATGKTGKGYEAHHTLPQKYRTDFEKAGINIDEPGNVVWRETTKHRKGSKQQEKAWDTFFEGCNKTGVSPTKDKIYKERESIEQNVWKNKGDIPNN